jgi:RNA-binding protein YlmH
MPSDEQQIKKRFEELALRSEDRGSYSYSEFLTAAEQGTLCHMRLSSPFSLSGGYPSAERKIAVFGSLELCGYEEETPICSLAITPTSPKFADSLTHRDFLGSLMGIGIRREVLGDIIISDNCGCLFCLDSIADYITQTLTQVKHTTVRVSPIDVPPLSALKEPDISTLVVASERLDAVIASVYKLSRAESQKLFIQGKVFVGGRQEERVSFTLDPGATISVRGFGRFIYEGIEKETRSGRLRVNVRIF